MKALLMLVLLSGCTITGRAELPAVPPDDYYTRAEIDAINAARECRAQARTMVQISRCDVRR